MVSFLLNAIYTQPTPPARAQKPAPLAHNSMIGAKLELELIRTKSQGVRRFELAELYCTCISPSLFILDEFIGFLILFWNFHWEMDRLQWQIQEQRLKG